MPPKQTEVAPDELTQRDDCVRARPYRRDPAAATRGVSGANAAAQTQPQQSGCAAAAARDCREKSEPE